MTNTPKELIARIVDRSAEQACRYVGARPDDPAPNLACTNKQHIIDIFNETLAEIESLISPPKEGKLDDWTRLANRVSAIVQEGAPERKYGAWPSDADMLAMCQALRDACAEIQGCYQTIHTVTDDFNEAEGKLDVLPTQEDFATMQSERDAAVNRAEKAEGLVREFVSALDAGAIQLASQEIGGEEPQGPDDPGYPAHPWHDEWLHAVRAALSPETSNGGDNGK